MCIYLKNNVMGMCFIELKCNTAAYIKKGECLIVCMRRGFFQHGRLATADRLGVS